METQTEPAKQGRIFHVRVGAFALPAPPRFWPRPGDLGERMPTPSWLTDEGDDRDD